MVAIVSGNSLGLELTSLGTLGSQGLFGQAGQGSSGERVYVNVATGNLVVQRRDDFIASKGLDNEAVRTYNSLGLANDGDNNDNWSLGVYAQQIALTGTVNTAGSTMVRTARDGSQAIYSWDAARLCYVTTAGDGAHDTIVYDAANSQYVRTDGSSGEVEKYSSANGRLQNVADAYGNTKWYTYTNGKLTKILDKSGQSIYYDYTGNQLTGVRTEVGGTDANGNAIRVFRSVVSYAYETYGTQGNTRLKTVTVDLTPEDGSITDGKVYTTTYTYDADTTRVATLKQSDGTALTFTYVLVGSDYRVQTVTDALGAVTGYAYDTAARRTTVTLLDSATDPSPTTWLYDYDSAGQLVMLTSPSVNGASITQKYEYDAAGNATKITNGDGEAVTMDYDGNGNQKQVTDHLGNTVTRTFDAASNQLLTETAGGSTTRYVYSATKTRQLRFAISGEGRVTQYIYDGLGQRTSEISYLVDRYDTSGLGSTAVPTEAQMTSWAGGLADLTETARKDYAYDGRGQLNYRSEYLNANADGTGKDLRQTQYVYDPYGRLLQVIEEAANTLEEAGTPTTTYTYDGLGRLLSVVDAHGAVTTTSYGDSLNQVTVTKPQSGAVVTSAYDKAGRLISVTRSDGSKTSYAYDAAGRLLMTTDPTGVRTFNVYDDIGRLVGTVDGTGTLTETTYDKAGRVTRVHTYSTKIAQTALYDGTNAVPKNPALAAIRPATVDPDLDRWSLYDDAGRLVYEMANSGAVTQHDYDSAGRIVRTTAYSVAITAVASPTVASVATALADPAVVAGAADDRTERFFYDGDGLLLGKLDGEGYLVRNTYDMAGRLVQTRRYATVVAANLRATATLAALTPATAPKDQVETFFYDARGMVRGQVDAEGYVTKNWYNDRGQLRDQTRYSTALSGIPDWKADFDSLLLGIRPDGGNVLQADDRKSFWYYTLDGQLLKSVNFEGTSTSYEYDAAGRLTTTTVGANRSDPRATRVRYDEWGRKTRELSANSAAKIKADTTADQLEALWNAEAVQYGYDSAGRLTSVTDANKHTTLYYYDEDGRLNYTVNALGEVEQKQYNTLGQLTATVRYDQRISRTGLSGGLVNTDLTGRIVANAAKDSKTGYQYDGAGRLIFGTAADGATTQYHYNAFGEVDERWVPWKGGTDINLDKRHDLQKFDRRGQLVSTVTDADAATPSSASTRYDAFGRAIESTDPNGQKRQFSYDRLGRQVEVIDPLNKSRKTTYDAFSQVLTVENELHELTTYAYNKANSSVTVTTPENVTTTTVRTYYGEVYKITANGVDTVFSYDRVGNLTQKQVGGTVVEARHYDADNRLVDTVDANEVRVVYDYDAANRVLTRTVDPKDPVTNPDGLELVTSYVYDGKGQAVTVTDPESKVTSFTYDGEGRVLTRTVVMEGTAPDLVTTFTYDAGGRTLTVKQPEGQVTLYGYDRQGRRTSEQVDRDGLKVTRTMAYDAAGNVVTVIDGANGVTRYAYDAAGRLTYTVDAAGGITKTDYDDAGRVKRSTRYVKAATVNGLANVLTQAQIQALIVATPGSDEIEARRYDHDGRLSYTVDGTGAVVKFEYDANGQVTRRTAYAKAISLAGWSGDVDPPVIPDGARDHVERYTYDTLGRRTHCVKIENAADGLGSVTRYNYDDNGNLLEQVEFAAKLAKDGDPATLTVNTGTDRIDVYRYDSANRKTWHNNAVGGVTKFEYDDNGNLRWITEFAQPIGVRAEPSTAASTPTAFDRVTEMRYDDAGRLTYTIDAEKGVKLNSYDKNGRLTATTRFVNKLEGTRTLDTLASEFDRTESYGYDGAGRLQSRTDAVGAITWYTYNGLGLVETETAAKGVAEQSVTVYAYDAAGHLLSKTVGYGTDSASTANYQVDALGQVTAEIDPRGTALTLSNSTWAKAERIRLGYAEDVASLTAANKQALLTAFTSKHAYDGAGRRISTTNALGAKTSTLFDAFGNAIKVTDPLGNSSFFYFDGLNRTTLQVDAEGYANEITYDNAFNNQVKSVWRRFTKVPAGTDEKARPTITLDAVNDARLQYAEYDRLDRLTKSSDHLGNYESTTYVVNGNRFDKQVRNKLAGVATYSYDKLGRLVQETLPVQAKDASGTLVDVVNTYSYNGLGDRIGMTEAVGLPEQRSTTFQFDKAGRVLRRIGMTYTAYDAVAGTTSSVRPVEVTSYDKLGRVIGLLSGANWVNGVASGGTNTFSYYDAAGRKTAQVERDGAMTEWTYDAAGNVYTESVRAKLVTPPTSAGGTPPAAVADAANDRITTSLYDAAGRLVEARRAAVVFWEQADGGAITLNLSGTQPATITLLQNNYDANGNLVLETDARGNTVYNYFDKLGRKTLRIDQEGYATGWAYDDVFDKATSETRYAVRVASYARQDDTTKSIDLRTPAKLTAGLASADNRVTTFTFDRAGRNTEKRVLAVDYQFVGSSGTIISGTADAITKYGYNALDNVTKIQERYGLYADGTEQWNTTDVVYDNLGRQITSKAPSITGYQGSVVRMQTDTEYNGLGDVVREIRRGTDTVNETDDRITVYAYNVNGLRKQVTDAEGNVTLYDYDAAGNVSRRTMKAVKNADGGTADLVTTYVNDVRGRVTTQTDVGTGEVRRYRYNAFGQVSGKGLGAGTTWQEFIEYSTLGRIQKSNSDGGATKIYLYDKNGNATREIASPGGAVDLTGMVVTTAAANTQLVHTFSIYDKRNQLVRTVEPDITFLRDHIEGTDGAFSQALVTDPYAPIGLDGSDGGRYVGGQVNDDSYLYTNVGGSDSSDAQKMVTPATAVASGAPTYGSPAAQGTVAQTVYDSFTPVAWSGVRSYTNTSSTPSKKAFPIPASWPLGNYRVREVGSNNVLLSGSNATAALTFNIPAGQFGSGDTSIDFQLDSGQWVSAAALHFEADGEPTGGQNQSGDDLWMHTEIWSSKESRLIIPTNASVTKAFAVINAGLANETVVPCVQVKDCVTGAVVTGCWAIDTSSLAANTYAITYRGFDANGNTVSAAVVNVTVSDGCTINSTATVAKADLWASTDYVAGNTRGLFFRPDKLVGTGAGTLHYRVAGSGSSWSSLSLTNWSANISTLAASATYEYIVQSTNGSEFYGKFTLDSAGTPALADAGQLRSVTRPAQTFKFDFTGKLSDLGATSRTATVTLNGVTVSKTVVTEVVNGSNHLTATFTAAEFSITPAAWSNAGYTYKYEVRGERNPIDQFIGQGTGTIQFGSDPKNTNTATTTAYRPLALLTLPTGTSLSGALTVGPAGATVPVPVGDWRRSSPSSTVLAIDLSQWLTWAAGTTKTITVSYSAADAVFSGSYTLKDTGQTDCVSLSSQTRQPLIPITVTGATRLSVLKVGASDTSLASVDINTRVTTSGSIFTWNAADQAGLGARRFYYEAVDASGNIVGKGYGSFTLQTSGTLDSTMDTPLLKPSIFYLTPPANTTTFELRTRLKGSTGAYTLQTVTTVAGTNQKAFDASSLRPPSGTAVYEYLQVAKDASGKVLASGGGDLSITSAGAVTSTHYEDKLPTIVTLYGPPGRNVPKMLLRLRDAGSTGAFTETTLTGVWDATRNCSVFTWNASAFKLAGSTTSVVPDSGTEQYDYEFDLQKADGTAYTNELGAAITMEGLMTLGGSATQPMTLQQSVKQLQVSAQVQHRQSYNAFGEISEEYDDTTLARAQAMAAKYGGTADANQVRTTFVYNKLGKLVTKTDPQTHVTAENGYRYRTRPVTTYGYDMSGRMATSTDANGHVMKQRFAGQGERVYQQWTGDGAETLTEYDIFGDLRRTTSQVTSTLDRVVEYTYDDLGNMLTATRLGVTRVENFTDTNAVAGTLTDTYTYDALGHRLTHTNALGWVDKTFYDSLGRVTKSISALGSTTTYAYSFVAAGTTAANGGIIGTGGASLGGYKLTTTGSDGRSTIDRTDYFGLTTWHQDQGARTYVYTYDMAGRLASQTSSAGQDIRYGYYANGFIKESRDMINRRLSRYGYDNSGDRVWEMYSNLDTAGTGAVGLYQDSKIVYDELGRMSYIEDVSYDIQYEYDAVGNRRAVHATYKDPLWDNNIRRREDFWYLYDATNRFTMTKGALSTGGTRGTSLSDTSVSIVQGAFGIKLTYDLAGQRTSARYETGSFEEYSYSSDGLLEDVKIGGVLRARRRVDSLGRTLQYKEYNTSGTLAKTTDSTYDRDNRLLTQKNADGTTTNYYFTDTTDSASTTTGKGALARTVFTPTSGTATTTSYTYEYWDGAKQKTIKRKTDVEDWAPGVSDMRYDVNGYLVSARDVTGHRTLSYFNSATGQVLRRDETRDFGTASTSDDVTFNHFWYYANSRRVGEVTTDPNDNQRISYAESLARSLADPKKEAQRNKNIKPVTSADFDQNYEPISPSYPASTPSTYTCSSGDTLRSIALALWGDSEMWFELAQVNNLQGDEQLVSGQVLIVPNRVTNIHNNANTFRPYNPGEVIGNVDPTLPAPPPQPDSGCGAVGTIIMVVVAVVVTVWTAGAAAPAIASMLGSTAVAAGSTMAVGAAALAGGAGMMTAGVAIASAAVGAAVGSIASQLVGIAIGATDDFSWKAVAQSALAAGVTAGVGAALTPAASTATTAVSSGQAAGTQAASAAASSSSWISTAGEAALRSGLSAAATQAIQGKWSWRAVAAASVGSAAGSAASSAMSGALGTAAGEGFGKLAKGLASAMVGGWASSEVMATDPRYKTAELSSLFASGLGNALGSSIAESMQGGVDWSKAPDQSAAESARLERTGNPYAYWPDQTDAETARLNRSSLVVSPVDQAAPDSAADGLISPYWDSRFPSRSPMFARYLVAPAGAPGELSSIGGAFSPASSTGDAKTFDFLREEKKGYQVGDWSQADANPFDPNRALSGGPREMTPEESVEDKLSIERTIRALGRLPVWREGADGETILTSVPNKMSPLYEKYSAGEIDKQDYLLLSRGLTLSQGNEQFRDALILAQTRTGVPASSIAAVINAEAAKLSDGSWNPNSVNGNAVGMTQFMPDTWLGEAATPGTYLNEQAKLQGLVDQKNKILDRESLLKLRTDPTLAIVAAAEYDKGIYDGNVAKGRIIPANLSPTEQAHYLYIGHHEGPTGSARFIDDTLTDANVMKAWGQNVPKSEQQSRLDGANGSYAQAYKAWLWDYTQKKVTPSKFGG
ncbi:hypothetical protein [Ideonella sp. YS5]|uniref:hypothetical protein n=1 Tax=Ideonella sp. YS5 TaxID=3453714 RepID=UPI003EECE4F9